MKVKVSVKKEVFLGFFWVFFFNIYVAFGG